MRREKSITSNLWISILYFAIVLFSPQVSTAFEKPNILLITVDFLRNDHVGVYGYALPVTPDIDRIANEGIIFANAITQRRWTSPAMIYHFTSY